MAAMVLAVVGLSASAGFGQSESASSGNRPAAERAAVELLQRAARVPSGGETNQLLISLRYLGDPALMPFFDSLAQRQHPVPRIHGLLGRAELRDPPRLELDTIAAVDERAIQAELISAGLDNDLIPNRAMRKMLDWPGLAPGPKVLLAVRLIEAGRFDKPAVLREAMAEGSAARRALAALLLHQIGAVDQWPKQAGMASLSGSRKQRVVITLLRTALKHEIDGIASWASQVSEDGQLDARIGRLALRAAMRFGDEEAVERWRQWYKRAANPADRIRLALLALRLSPWLEPDVFDPLTESDSRLFRRMGETGRTIARDGSAIPDKVMRLVGEHHPAVNQWALSYANEQASDHHARLILLGLILASRDAEPAQRRRQLQTVAEATQALFKKTPDQAPRLLRPLLEENRDKPLLLQGILLGLVRSRESRVGEAIKGGSPFADLNAANLAVLVRARSGLALSESDLAELGTIVRGGGALRPSLRIQAAWWYLKRTGRLRAALSRALTESSDDP